MHICAICDVVSRALQLKANKKKIHKRGAIDDLENDELANICVGLPRINKVFEGWYRICTNNDDDL